MSAFYDFVADGTGKYIMETPNDTLEYLNRMHVHDALVDYWNRLGSCNQVVRVTYRPRKTTVVYAYGEVPRMLPRDWRRRNEK